MSVSSTFLTLRRQRTGPWRKHKEGRGASPQPSRDQITCVSAAVLSETFLPVVCMARGLPEPLLQAVRVIGGMPDEDPFNDLLDGHRVLAKDGQDDGAVEVRITERAQVGRGHRAVVTQQGQNLILR